jgi:CheY-like chemotaxis protein
MAEGLSAVLAVRDEGTTRADLERALEEARFQVAAAATGEDVLRLAARHPDLIILDSDPPDLSGPELCRRLRADAATAAIPVLRLIDWPAADGDAEGPGGPDADLARPVTPGGLIHALGTALRRRAVQGHGRALGAPAGPAGASPSLRAASPAAFDGLVEDYGRLLHQMLDQREYRVDHHTSEGLRALAGRFGALGAGPRDVVEVHGAALRRLGAGQPARRAHALAEEGRLSALELMGHLVSYYRRQALGPPDGRCG